MNKFMNGLTDATNYITTENGATSYRSTKSDLLDMFALGAAMRSRSVEDVILMFKKAYEENPTYALKCLFYIGDCRGGQGERRFFRVCIKWLANNYPDVMRRNIQYVPTYRRWDDLYALVDTPLENDAFAFMKEQLALDVECKTPSLLAKWLKSENTSSRESRRLGNKTRIAFGMNHKQYRKTLAVLRERINVLERLMSENRWDEIEFDKIPSRAGLIYKNAFARHDLEREQSEKNVTTYAEFAKSKDTKVNAKALYPYECVAEALKLFRTGSYWNMRELPPMDDTNRLIVNKYWDNLEQYFSEASFDGIAVVDTSGSMVRDDASAPINVAISLGLYCAEKAKGPYAGHYISFASRPQLIKTEGVDFVDKVQRIYKTNLVDNTNIEATFDLLLNTAIQNQCSQDEIPKNVIIISDQEFDAARGYQYWNNSHITPQETLMESIEKKWNAAGYKLPTLTFWNVDARQNNIPMTVKDGVNFVSGMSPSIFQQIMENKNAFDLMYSILNSERYSVIG